MSEKDGTMPARSRLIRKAAKHEVPRFKKNNKFPQFSTAEAGQASQKDQEVEAPLGGRSTKLGKAAAKTNKTSLGS